MSEFICVFSSHQTLLCEDVKMLLTRTNQNCLFSLLLIQSWFVSLVVMLLPPEHLVCNESETKADTQETHAHEPTEPLSGPPVRLFGRREPDVRVKPQALIQVRRATLGLTDDVEVGQTAQPLEFPIVPR